ncbi:TBP-associated factor 2 isoform X2 [Wolffia australiana]
MAKPRKQKATDQASKSTASSTAAGIVLRQKICLSVDVERRMIFGHTEMDVIFPESEIIGLNTANLITRSVLVNGEPAEFEYLDPFPKVKDDEGCPSVSTYSTAAEVTCTMYCSSLEKEMIPNLFISCHKMNKENDVDILANGDAKLQNTEGEDNGHQLHQNVQSVRINYQIDATESCVLFGNSLVRTENQIRRARCWFPCMDGSSQCSCYDLEITVDSNLVAVSSGDLLYQVLSKDEPPKKTYVYKLDVPVSAGWISLAVGPFEILADSHNAVLSYMSMPADFSKLRNTVGFFHSAFSFYEDYLSTSFPFRSYKQVFIPPESSLSPANLGASMCIFGSNLLFDEKVIDETIEIRIKLAHALARQWFGAYIIAESPNDEWLVDGIAGFLADAYIKRFLGNNEVRYRRYKANCTVCKADICGATALSSSAATRDLYGTHRLGVFGKAHLWKSIAILHMLEKQMGPESFRKIMQLVIYRAQEPSRPVRTLSTKEFRHFANKVGNLERPYLREFFPRWVESCGCPILRMGFSYNKRRNMVEVAAVRDSTAPGTATETIGGETKESAGGWPGMTSIRVHELDGVYDHPSLPLTGESCQLLEIQCHSKLAAKRIQKPKKGAKLDGADESVDAVSATDVRACMDSPLLWLRVDPEMEYLAEIHFHQPAQMWINQMEKDKDVVAQSQAIGMLQALPQHPFSVINALNNLLNDSKCFWRVRIEAAIALAQTASEETDWAGLHYLIKFYKSRRFDPEIWLPMPNDFHDVPEYFVLKAIPQAIASVRAADGTSPREAVEFILQLLKYNDNSGNPYSDAHWLAALVQSMGELEFGAQNVALLTPLLKRIDRLLLFDSLMPSHNNILTISCIRTVAQIALKMSSSVPSDQVLNLMRSFRDKERAPWGVRLEASKALLSLHFHWSGIGRALSQFLEFLAHEASPRGQAKLAAHAACLCEANAEPEAVDAATLVALLRLIRSQKAYNNIYLRNHLFSMLQALAGRPPTLYGRARGRMQTMQEHLLTGVEEGKRKMITSFLNLKEERPPPPPPPPPQPLQPPPPQPLPMPLQPSVPQPQQMPLQPPVPQPQQLPLQPPVPQPQQLPLQPPVPQPQPVEMPIASTSEAARDVAFSTGSERKYPVVKIKVRQPTPSVKIGMQSEGDLGPTSSVSVDAPQRAAPENLEEADSVGNRETATKRKKKEKTDERKRRGEEDAEYLEKKRRKKEKKRREKELAKAKARESVGDVVRQEDQTLALADGRSLGVGGPVEPTPAPSSSIGTKVRIKLKRPIGN